MTYRHVFDLKIDETLYDFLEHVVLAELEISSDHFWDGLSQFLNELGPENARLLKTRDEMQARMDQWDKENLGQPRDLNRYKNFLQSIDYIAPDLGPCLIETETVDLEISTIAGPQLVVPVNNARYAINAVNARWGSLYDALYGSDALGKTPSSITGYDASRGAEVIDWGKSFLDSALPLQTGSFKDISGFIIDQQSVLVSLDGELVPLKSPEQFVGYQGETHTPSTLLFANHGLHIELKIDSAHPVGKMDPANLADIMLESALSTIMDFEDSVAAVDAEDKVAAYENWLGLMKGDLKESFKKNGKFVDRVLNPDRKYSAPDGSDLCLHGRSLLLVRNVGHLMTTPAVLDKNGNEVPEGLLDGMVTSLIALYDLKKKTDAPVRNSRSHAIYIVKPKMHGPGEVAFACKAFGQIEALLGLEKNTIKIGIMDEERRTSVNLKECIRAAKERIFFINTGFLDRTGDEIHSSLHAGAMIPKALMKTSLWMEAYENRNVDIGLACGFPGKAQIGKGMWAMPELMADMLLKKIEHPLAGANTAWVPSPTAATLHATHYHQVDIFARQILIKNREPAALDDLLTVPLAPDTNWPLATVQAELENNAQGILGYVVKWIDQGIGCSKVPDISNIGLMEDRATLRISSQHIANWLLHGIVNKEQVMETMRRMAKIVDEQNIDDPSYVPMSPSYEGIAFHAACDLIFKGAEQPSGYTEPILHLRRQEKKKLTDLGIKSS